MRVKSRPSSRLGAVMLLLGLGVSACSAAEQVPVAETATSTEAVDENPITVEPPELAEESPVGPPGDSAFLDGLWERCEDADFVACDDLFLESPTGSIYEEFGDTCGNRNDPSGYCEDLYGDSPRVAEYGEYGSDAYLDRLWDACDAGDFIACDDLYDESPVGSAYEYFGDTCGLRNDPSDYCEFLYG